MSRTGTFTFPSMYCLSICVCLGSAGAAFATPNHAHLHYQMGVRAYAGTRHAAALHLEVSDPGCELTLAREDAVDMERLADELHARAVRLDGVLSEQEAAAIAGDVATMTALALEARRLSAELGVRIDETLEMQASSVEAPAGSREELRRWLAMRCRELFAAFGEILKVHKRAERRLGIPVPPDPPPLESD